MNFLVISDVSLSKVIGGAERVLAEHCTRFVARGHAVRILTRKQPHHRQHKEHIHGVMEWRYPVSTAHPATFLISTLIHSRSAYLDLIETFMPDAVLIHQPFSALGMCMAGVDFPAKRIYICHSLAFEEYASRYSRPADPFGKLAHNLTLTAMKRLEWFVMQRCHGVVCLSQYTRDKLIHHHHIQDRRISVIPGGVDLDRFRPIAHAKEIRKQLGIDDDRIVLFTVRNLVPRMGLEHLIEAMKIIVNAEPRICLVVGGQGPLRSKLVQLTRDLGLTRYIQFAGFIDEQDLPKYYAMADLFVLPTRELEGFGLVTLESLACGTPVVGTPVGGTLEILGKLDPGFLFHDASADAMAQLIVEKCKIIRHHPDTWVKISSDCRNYAQKHYHWDHHIHQLLSLVDHRSI